MDFQRFMEYAKAQDPGCKFTQLSSIPSFVPVALHPFYQSYNPTNVEIDFDEATVHFYPVDELEKLQAEYDMPEGFVFATCNGDPIFLANGAVYTYPHGVRKPTWEQLNGKLATFFSE